jgi:hypothetical protein
MFKAWWVPFSHYGVIHGDPHLGNYTVFDVPGSAVPATRSASRPASTCSTTAASARSRPSSCRASSTCTPALRPAGAILVVHAYETWGFTGLSSELIDVLNIWARFIYGPLLDDREREIAEGTTPGQYGRKEAFTVHKALKEKGPVRVPREFVFMDRAADRAWRGVPASGRPPQLARHLQRDHRGLRSRRRGCAPEGHLRGCGRSPAGGCVRSALRSQAARCVASVLHG